MKVTMFRGVSTSCKAAQSATHFMPDNAKGLVYIYKHRVVALVNLAVFAPRPSRIWLIGDVDIV